VVTGDEGSGGGDTVEKGGAVRCGSRRERERGRERRGKLDLGGLTAW
jgi:hypothetical protein